MNMEVEETIVWVGYCLMGGVSQNLDLIISIFQKVQVLFQSVYFHTSLVCNNIVPVVELIASGLDEHGC